MLKKSTSHLITLFIILTLFLVACSSPSLDTKLASLEKDVAHLFNEQKTDISETIDKDTLDELNELIEEVKSEAAESENLSRIEEVETDFQLATDMFLYEKDVEELIHQNGEFEEDEFWALKEKLEAFEAFVLFQERLTEDLDKIEQAYKAAKHNKKTEKSLAKLFTKDNEVIDDITQEAYDQVKELVDKVEDADTKERFETLLAKIHTKLQEVLLAEEEAARLAEEEREAELEEDTVENEQVEGDMETNQNSQMKQTPTNDWRPTAPSRPSYTAPTRPSRPSGPSQNNAGSSSNNNSSGQADSGSSSSGSGSSGSSSSSSSNDNQNNSSSSNNNSKPGNDSNNSSSDQDNEPSIGDAYEDNGE